MDILESKFKPVREEPEKPDDKLEYIRENRDRIARELMEAADEKIGEGNSSNVYVDPEYPDLCYKHITRGVGVNTIQEEAEFLEAVRDIDSQVGVPLPTMTISFDYKKDEEELHCNALAMERINGMTLDQISTTQTFPEGVEPKSKADLKALRDSFQEVRKFVEEMNSRLGIYHTDLKERNIMLDEEGKWWIIDFGEAKKEHFQEAVGNTDSEDLKQTWKKFALFASGHIENLQK